MNSRKSYLINFPKQLPKGCPEQTPFVFSKKKKKLEINS